MMSNVNTLQQVAASVAHNPATSGPVRIARITANHWPNPTADFTVFLSNGTSQTLVKCSLVLVGVSTTDAAFQDWVDSAPHTVEQLSSLAAKDFTSATHYCCALQYNDLFVLLANLDVERNCVAQLRQEVVKRDIAKKFGGNTTFLNFVFRKVSPLIIAVVSQYYAVQNIATKVSQSNTRYLRAVDGNGTLTSFDNVKKTTTAAAAAASSILKRPKSLSSGARLLANLAKVKPAATSATTASTTDSMMSRTVISTIAADDDNANNTATTSAESSAKKPRRKRFTKKTLKPTKVIGANEFDVGDGGGGGYNDVDDEIVLASASHVRRLTAEQIAERDRIATMFAGFETTNRVRIPIYLTPFEVQQMVEMFKGVSTKPHVYDFPLLNDISVSKNNWVEFPHDWFGADESAANSDASAARIGNVVTWVIRRIISQKEPTVPECLVALSTRQPNEIDEWYSDSPFEANIDTTSVYVRHVSVGADGNAARNTVAARSMSKGTVILNCSFARQLQSEDLLGIYIGFRICGVSRALAVPTNITYAISDDTSLYVLFNSLSHCVTEDDALLFVGDTRGEPNARVLFNASNGVASLELLRDVAEGEPIVINRGDAFRAKYKALTGNEFLQVTGGTEDVQKRSLDEMVARLLSKNEIIQVQSPPATPPPSLPVSHTTATTDNLRQRALDILDPSKSPSIFGSGYSPCTPLNKKRALPFDDVDNSAKQRRALADDDEDDIFGGGDGVANASSKMSMMPTFDDANMEVLRLLQDGDDDNIAQLFGYTQ